MRTRESPVPATSTTPARPPCPRPAAAEAGRAPGRREARTAPGGPFLPFRDPVNPLRRTDCPWVQSCLYDTSDGDRAQPSGGPRTRPAGHAPRPPPCRLSSGPIARAFGFWEPVSLSSQEAASLTKPTAADARPRSAAPRHPKPPSCAGTPSAPNAPCVPARRGRLPVPVPQLPHLLSDDAGKQRASPCPGEDSLG